MSAAPRVRIAEIAEFRGGGTPSKSRPEFYRGDIPWVTPKDMKSWEINSAKDKITQEALKHSATNLVPSGSILVVNRSGILKHTVPIALARRDVAINQDIKAIICGRNASPDYVARLIKASEPIILGWVRATTADNFPLDNLKELEIPLPPLDEQMRIAAILDQADNLRRLRQRAIDRLNALGQAIFYEMFVETEEKDWPIKTVGDISVQTRTGPFGSQLLHSEFVDAGIAVLGIDNAVNNEFRWGAQRFISEEKYRELSRYTVEPGDVLITIMGTCGRCALVPEGIPTSINTKHLCCITLDKCQMLPQFLHAAFLEHPEILKQLGIQAKGAVMPGLNMGIIRDLNIRVPPLERQEEYGRKITELKVIRDTALAQASVLDANFSSLQHRAFTGQL